MAKNKEKKPEPDSTIPDELKLTGMAKKPVSPLNAPVWRLLLLIAAGCTAAWLIQTIFGTRQFLPSWLVALFTGSAWVAAIRMLMLDARVKKFWVVWHAFGFFLILLFGSTSGIWIASVSFSFVFLLVRRYRPYRHLTSRRRAALFLIGLLSFSLLTLGWLPSKLDELASPQPEDIAPVAETGRVLLEPGSAATLSQNIARYSIWSLRLFWFFSLFRLFFSIRLHFMKLKPKLAISTFLIAIVPLILIIIMGLLTLYSVLGESYAARAQTILKDWASFAAQNESFVQQISDRPFSHRQYGENIQVEGNPPSWIQDFLVATEKNESFFSELDKSDSAVFIWEGSEIWMIIPQNPGKPNVRIYGCMVDSRMMNRLAGILHSDVSISFEPQVIFAGIDDEDIKIAESDLAAFKGGIHGKFLPESEVKETTEDASPSLWKQPLYFGMTHLDVIIMASGQFRNEHLIILLKTNLVSIIDELFSQGNPLSMAVMIVLISLGVFLLIMETFAFFFGVRITTGITSAVKALHKATCCIAEGDLDSKIDIPNEDELGDLAASFNEMTTAVKRGRKEAIERERLEQELKTAREIQERLLPHEMPSVPGFEISGISLPSQQVGGDYFDFLEMDTGHLGIAIGDVSGKGMPAALLMANLQASLHGQAISPNEVADVVSRINKLLVRSTDSHMFATFFYGVLDRQKSTFISSNAGHNPPLLVRSDGKIERLESGGLIIGFLPDQTYKQQVSKIEPEDVVVLYTDGITEAENPSPEQKGEKFFGEERLIQTIQSNISRSARKIQSAILHDVSEHMGDSLQNDDITLVIIKRTVKKRDEQLF